MKTGKTTSEGKKIVYKYPDELENELVNQIPEVFQQEVYKLGRRKKDAVYVDLGANIGSAVRYFYPFAKKIYAVEPNPTIYQALVENTKNLPKVETFNFAIGHMSGHDYMYSNEGSLLAQTFFGNRSSVNATHVDVKSLEDFFNENKIDHVDVLKIDVEEAEYIIFPSEGFSKVADRIDFIIGEAHFQKDGGFPDVIPLMLKDYGFKTTFLDNTGENYTRKFTYEDTMTGKRKEWTVPYQTIFIAEK